MSISMDSSTKGMLVIAVLVLSFVGYKYWISRHDPIDFMGETYEHVEDLSPNDYVETHFYTVGGRSINGADKWIQVTTLDERVSEAQRDSVDRQIRASMGVSEVPGYGDRYFGLLQDSVIQVLLLEQQYILYVYTNPGKELEELQSDSLPIFEAMDQTFVY